MTTATAPTPCLFSSRACSVQSAQLFMAWRWSLSHRRNTGSAGHVQGSGAKRCCVMSARFSVQNDASCVKSFASPRQTATISPWRRSRSPCRVQFEKELDIWVKKVSRQTGDTNSRECLRKYDGKRCPEMSLTSCKERRDVLEIPREQCQRMLVLIPRRRMFRGEFLLRFGLVD